MAIEETKDISTSPFPTILGDLVYLSTSPFPTILGDLVYYRTYSELLTDECTGKLRLQTWDENAARNATFIAKLGELTDEQRYSIYKLQRDLVVTPPGRVLWAAKDEWVDRDGLANYLGLFNCVGIRPTSWKWFGYNFLLLMMGCGVGAVIEEEVIYELPPINSTVPEVAVVSKPGDYPYRPEDTTYTVTDSTLTIKVGDSKEGWVDSYVKLLTTCSDPSMSHITHINIELGGVRPNGTPIKGFGGTANPIALAPLYENVIKILKGAAGRNITSYEACLLLNWAALTTVAGNIRRSARWDGYSHGSPTMTGAKEGVWECDPDTGEWRINPEKDVLRMVNISAIMHTKPTPEQCLESVRKQHQTGEGALWYAPAALVRANADLLPTDREKRAFENAYTLLGKETARAYLRSKLHEKGSLNVERELEHRMTRYGANPCCEILGRDFVCSLSQVELGTVDVKSPTLWEDINEALDTASLIVCSLLKRGFAIPELQWSREMDPIVAVTLNGVFDFMVNYFGEPWLRWWMAGCPPYWNDTLHNWNGEQSHLSQWFMQETERILNSFRDRVRDTVVAYCTLHNLTIPNRYTAMQPSGSKSTVTGGTPACYTPKGMYWIRRVTLRREHPVALAAIDYGYKVIPSSSCKDDNGNLLDDPYDERVQEWFVEIPCRCTWSSQIEGEYAVERAPITSQWYLTMACQKHYVTHNTSVTFEINEHEIPTLAKLIYDEIQAGGDYISGAIFSRDSSTMPRMPYESISMEEYHAMVYDAEQRRKSNNFKELAEYYYNVDTSAESGPTIGCDGDSCTIPSMPQ